MLTAMKEYIDEFGITITVSKLLYHYAYKRNSKVANIIINNNERMIKAKLRKTVTNSIGTLSIRVKDVANNIPYNSVIWVMWWQGSGNMPDIVKACVKRIKRLNSNHRVIILTRHNYEKYVKLNPEVLRKFHQNKISKTHLSDIIRVNLLYSYGGVWIDATVFETAPLPDSIFARDFFTIKTGSYTNDPSHGMWTTFFMESQRHNELMAYLVNAFNVYCLKYNEWIDYILFDYFIRIAYENYETIRRQIEKIPINNQNVFELKKCLNEQFDCLNLRSQNTYLFKLTYKERLNRKTKKGKPTLYSKIIDN